MPEKILIIDDDVDSLRLIGLMLQRQGYDVTTANAGNPGIAKAVNEIPSLIILDVMMPDMDGYEVCRRIRANPATQSIPIIMFTAKTLIDDKMAGFEAGVDDYLTKPTHPTELASRVKAILRRNATTSQPQKEKSEQGETIGVIGAKGGIGTTTIALNIAAALRMKDTAPIVADFRLGNGALGLLLGIHKNTGMANVLSRPAAEIPNLVEKQIVTHTTGLRAILSSTRSREALLPIPTEGALALVNTLRTLGNPTIFDLGSGYSPLVNRLKSEMDKLVLLIEPTGINLELAKTLLQELADPNKDRISVVVTSRNDNHSRSSWHEVERVLNHEIQAIISAAPELIQKAMEAGIPIVNHQPNAIVTSQLVKLANDIHSKA